MSTPAVPQDLARMLARGALPVLAFLACIAVAFVIEPLSALVLLLGIVTLGVMTASTIAQARHPVVAVTAAALATALVTLGIAAGSWAVLPIFWCVLAASAGGHLALRLLERRDTVTRVCGAVAGLCGGLFIGFFSPLRHTTVVGLLCILAIGGLAAFRLVRGAPARP